NDTMVLTSNTVTIDAESLKVGTLSVGTADETYIELPVYYSGYVYTPLPEEEDTAVTEAINTEAKEKSTATQKIKTILFIVAALIVLGLLITLIIKIEHVKKQRELRRRISAQRRINNREQLRKKKK
ncbi:MAG: hypothetical protein IJ054_09130, partial [Lachnospiraceae bacterium]|nr:hypothetical protein [Lachnospiraceae bacterium]